MERERSRVMKESIPKQLDKKSGVQEEEKGDSGSQRGDRGLEFSRRKKRHFFFSTFLSKDSVQLSRVRLFATPWTAACQASLSITTSGVYPNSCPLSR